jgi:hypothetical protein
MPTQLGNGLFDSGGRAAIHHHLGTGLRQASCDGVADASRGARYDGNFAGEIDFHEGYSLRERDEKCATST